MNFALVYLIQRALYRIGDFFHHWYVHGSRRFAHTFVSLLESLDETFAVKITLTHFFEPLYGDYSFMGRLLGPVFRIGRVSIGAAVYLVLTALFLCAYLVWLLVPVVLAGEMASALHIKI